jgi:hypothetical protein
LPSRSATRLAGGASARAALSVGSRILRVMLVLL